MRVLVWYWGRRGGPPQYAVDLVEVLRLTGAEAVLSLSAQAELMQRPDPPRCDLVVDTYRGGAGFLRRAALAPLRAGALARQVAELRPDVAICAMPAMLDFEMAAALRRCGIPFLVIVHDADLHPGDGLPLQMYLQRRLIRRADGLIALSAHVARRLQEQQAAEGKLLLRSTVPPFPVAAPPAPPRAHGGPTRVLFFGRLLAYKGLDLLVEAMHLLGERSDMTLRVVGSGPDSPPLTALRALPGVEVENRWVADAEIGDLLAWADAVVMPYREASQSGVAASALATGRYVVATRVGGLAEQLEGEPLARLCDPEPAAIAAGLAALLNDRGPPPPPPDPWGAWRAEMAELAAVIERRFVARRVALPAAA